MNMTENGKEWFFFGKSLLKKEDLLRFYRIINILVEMKCNEV